MLKALAPAAIVTTLAAFSPTAAPAALEPRPEEDRGLGTSLKRSSP